MKSKESISSLFHYVVQLVFTLLTLRLVVSEVQFKVLEKQYLWPAPKLQMNKQLQMANLKQYSHFNTNPNSGSCNTVIQ